MSIKLIVPSTSKRRGRGGPRWWHARQSVCLGGAVLPRSPNRNVPTSTYTWTSSVVSTGTFAGMLSEMSTYLLSLTLAHQHLSQLEEQTRDAILDNVGTTARVPRGAK